MMNHRSKVRSVIYGNENLMLEFIQENEELLKVVVYQGIVEQTVVGMDVVLHLADSDIQWSPEFPEVKAWQELMNLAESVGLAYEYMVISSEENISQSAGNSRGLISLVQTIEPNFITTLGV